MDQPSRLWSKTPSVLSSAGAHPGVNKALIMSEAHYLDPSDKCLEAILTYEVRTSPATPNSVVKVIPTDPTTKPLSIPAPRNRKEALVSPWWPGYYQAELLEMDILRKNGTCQ